jgi:tetrahydromethanopterin S-methyltransferase subunit F
MQLSDVLIHINEMPNESEQNDLVEQLRNLEGVIAPRFSQEKDHMLFVSYNSDTIDSTAMIEKVRENGYKAQLIGM